MTSPFSFVPERLCSRHPNLICSYPYPDPTPPRAILQVPPFVARSNEWAHMLMRKRGRGVEWQDESTSSWHARSSDLLHVIEHKNLS